MLILPEYLSLPPHFSGFHVAQYLVFCLVSCRQFFVLIILAIVLSVHLRFTASDYPFGIPIILLTITILINKQKSSPISSLNISNIIAIQLCRGSGNNDNQGN